MLIRLGVFVSLMRIVYQVKTKTAVACSKQKLETVKLQWQSRA